MGNRRPYLSRQKGSNATNPGCYQLAQRGCAEKPDTAQSPAPAQSSVERLKGFKSGGTTTFPASGGQQGSARERVWACVYYCAWSPSFYSCFLKFVIPLAFFSFICTYRRPLSYRPCSSFLKKLLFLLLKLGWRIFGRRIHTCSSCSLILSPACQGRNERERQRGREIRQRASRSQHY